MTLVDLTSASPEPATATAADRRLINLRNQLKADAYSLCNRLLLIEDPVVGTEMLGEIREALGVIKLIDALLEVEA